MSLPLSSVAHSRENNFNLIRFIAASLVLFSHSFAPALGGAEFEPLRSLIGMSWGEIAVDVFFITSGFLVTGSYFARQDIKAFIWARVLRVYPGLIVAVLLTVCVLGLWLTTYSVADYFSAAETHKYIKKNIILFSGTVNRLPGVIESVPYAHIANG